MKHRHFIRLGQALVGALMFCFTHSAFASVFSQEDIKQLLHEEAQYQGVSPSLVLAIARVESNFNPSALSHAGAKGVMQVMPATAKNGFQVEGDELFNARVNIRVGVAFIKQLLEQYAGQVDIALSHYNGGSRVKKANGTLAVIPATRDYVNKVKMYAQRYQQQGYDTGTPFVKPGTSAQLSLSYGQKIALDELDYTALAKQSLAYQQNKATPPVMNKVEAPKPRIDQLQDLRVHNLTRLLPPSSPGDKAHTSRPVNNPPLPEDEVKLAGFGFIRGPKSSSIEKVSPQTESFSVPDSPMVKTAEPDLRVANVGMINPQRPYEPPIEPVRWRQGDHKQKQVASWEAIFN